jgi:hypothetical protein
MRLLTVVVIAVLVRGGVLLFYPEKFETDPDAYQHLAVSLAKYQTFGFHSPMGEVTPTAFRPAGYPWLLSWLVSGEEIPKLRMCLLHLLLGVMTVVLTFKLADHCSSHSQSTSARRWFSKPTTMIAAVLVACDPILCFQSVQTMTETLATFLAVFAIWIWTRLSQSPTLGCGLLLGCALLCGFFVRPISIAWAGLLLPYSLLAKDWPGCSPKKETKQNWLATVPVTVILLMGIGLWMQRNQKAVGYPVWATTHGGYTLLLANNPPLYDHLRSHLWPSYWDPTDFFRGWRARSNGNLADPSFWKTIPDPLPITSNEIQDDGDASAAAHALIKREPATFVWSCLVRTWWLWSPIPQTGPVWQRTLVGIWYGVLYLGILFAICGRSKVGCFSRPWMAGWLLVVALTVTHGIYWSNMRMRAPALPFLCFISAMGMCDVCQSRKGRQNTLLPNQHRLPLSP